MANTRVMALIALFAVFLAFGVIGLGAFTRLIDAGLGCPDWPGCYGHFTLPLNDLQYPGVLYKAWAEMIHRYFAGSLGVVIISLFILSLRPPRKTSNLVLASGLVMLLIYQILLGQWTVTLKLWPIIVTQHLLGGYFILAFLWLIYLNNSHSPIISLSLLQSSVSCQRKLASRKATLDASFRWHDTDHREIIKFFSLIALLILIIQITLGAWTSTNYAALSCPGFPFCHQQDFPMHFKEAFSFLPQGQNYEGGVLTDNGRQTIQMTHRLGALVLILYFFCFIALSVVKLKAFPDLIRLLYMLAAILLLQLSIGMINIIYQLPLITAIAHTLTASLLLLVLLTFIYRLRSL